MYWWKGSSDHWWLSPFCSLPLGLDSKRPWNAHMMEICIHTNSTYHIVFLLMAFRLHQNILKLWTWNLALFSLDLLIIFLHYIYSSLLKHTKSQSTHIRHTPHTNCMETQKSILAKLFIQLSWNFKANHITALLMISFFIASSAETCMYIFIKYVLFTEQRK